ncbi:MULTISPECIES: phage tail domain-containing protein [Cryobacterium]|uniref:Phage tail protein n=1 Tax=Cryobacterium breve TaxID=1259258 RepID=A0ABY2J4Q9_9MICO|nr:MULTISPECIES: phage tail domain-containing protein [Cryobacterium]TFC92037.1 hypothetical protein E3T20_12030 [Cryobacterium sp. TmT3-12]TFC99824.1 hypothetical protein E3O65_05475 [Cryobacterium breve]
MTTFTIGGLTAEDGEMDRSRGRIYFSDLGDWYSGAESKTDINERAQGDGAHGIDVDLRGSAAFTFTGWYEGDTWADVLTMMDRFKQATITRRTIPVSVEDELGVTSRIVSVRAAPLREDKLARAFDFAIDMHALDPLRYGPAVSVSTGLPTAGGGITFPITYPISYGTPGDPGRVTVSNPGTAPTYSILEITGGMSGGFELTEVTTGRTLRFERPIPDGSTIYLNPRTGMVSMDGPSDVSRYLSRSEFWSVPAAVGDVPGMREIQFNSLGIVTGTPTLKAITAPAFW